MGEKQITIFYLEKGTKSKGQRAATFYDTFEGLTSRIPEFDSPPIKAGFNSEKIGAIMIMIYKEKDGEMRRKIAMGKDKWNTIEIRQNMIFLAKSIGIILTIDRALELVK